MDIFALTVSLILGYEENNESSGYIINMQHQASLRLIMHDLSTPKSNPVTLGVETWE